MLSGQWVCEGLIQPESLAAANTPWSLDAASAPGIGLHVELQTSGPLLPEAALNEAAVRPIESHLAEAHQATGWREAREQFGLTGAGQTVAVIDSGIAWDHVSLGGGYGPGYRVVGGWDFAENDALPYDDGPAGFHGTHVAGIVGSDDAQHPGVATGVDLVSLRVFNDFGQGQMAWVEQALGWVYANRNTFENPITTVNLSLGAAWNSNTVPGWGTLENELQQLANAGIVVIASAGNSFQQYLEPGLSYPAASPYVLPVASLDGDGQLSDFSQRNSSVLAAPGERILSTVPDYFLGRDGRLNDFANSSGTSMAAPYVAGAAVLVRQAMEMVGLDSINLSSIQEHLRATADTVYDAVTGANYHRLNLGEAIDALIPRDTVGDDLASATSISLAQNIEGWINHVNDRDVYRFSSNVSGTLSLDAQSEWASNLQWQITSQGQWIADSSTVQAIQILPGRQYELIVQSPGAIGAFTIDVDFTASSAGGNGNGEGPASPAQNLGEIDYRSENAQAGMAYRAQAANDGLFTVQWHQPAGVGSLSVTSGTTSLSDSTWSDGMLRVDLPVAAGDWVEFVVPGGASGTGRLDLANVVQQVGTQLYVQGTVAADEFLIDLQSGVHVAVGEVEYRFTENTLQNIQVDGGANNDRLTLIGSRAADKVELMPGRSTLVNNNLHVSIIGVEEVSFEGGGGADRAYLYDADTNDTLTARPRNAVLQGVGYRFEVDNVDRIFVHATGHGEDIAYLHDSAGDDTLSVRPQFMSMSGDNYFNYVRGFERVYAYASAGGWDVANLYDSSGNDRFMTNGIAASIVGPGFASYTRGFDNVTAYATAGGEDTAAMYAEDAQASWHVGLNQVTLQDQGWRREVRGFENYEAFVAGTPRGLSALADSEARLHEVFGEEAAGIAAEVGSLAVPFADAAREGMPSALGGGWCEEESEEAWSDWLAAAPNDLVPNKAVPGDAGLDEYLQSPELEFDVLDRLFGESRLL